MHVGYEHQTRGPKCFDEAAGASNHWIKLCGWTLNRVIKKVHDKFILG